MDAIFASVVITSIIALVALVIGLVAITYRQKDIAALALKVLSRTPADMAETPLEIPQAQQHKTQEEK